MEKVYPFVVQEDPHLPIVRSEDSHCYRLEADPDPMEELDEPVSDVS
jgi:hypothetical protein